MNLINNIKNFLYDKDYFISLFDNSLHLYGYDKIIKFDSEVLVFKIKNFFLSVEGDNLLVNKMLENEILISGVIKNLSVTYEE